MQKNVLKPDVADAIQLPNMTKNEFENSRKKKTKCKFSHFALIKFQDKDKQSAAVCLKLHLVREDCVGLNLDELRPIGNCFGNKFDFRGKSVQNLFCGLYTHLKYQHKTEKIHKDTIVVTF